MTPMKFIETIGLAKREAKGEATPEEVAWLADPANYRLWVQALRSAIADAVEQFDLQRERLERARNEVAAGILSQDAYRLVADAYDAWSKKANRYRLGLEQRLAEITATEQSEVERLRAAITVHRYNSQAPHSDADHELWSVLDV